MQEASSAHSRCVLIFGGTFDPPHLAHAALPAIAAAQLHCDEILYVPAAINPLKAVPGTPPPAAQEHRVAMLLMTIAEVPNARICSIELERPGPSYTIDTLRALRDGFGSLGASQGKSVPEFRLLIGCDQALNFHHWKQWQEILTLATPAVMVRPPWDKESFARELRERYSPVEAEQWLKWTLRLPRMDMSSTEIRQRLAEGQAVQGMLEPAVAQYIQAHGLYRSTSEPSR